MTNTTVNLPGEFDRDDLVSMRTLEDALRITQQTLGAEIVSASDEIGDGFALLENKDTICGIPCLLMSWTFNAGDYGEFVSVRVAAMHSPDSLARYIVNDGSTGLCAQLREFTDTHDGRQGGVLAKRGLRKSEYDNEFGHGITHYLDTGA